MQSSCIRTVRYITDGSNRLQLSSSFIDTGDTCITINTLTSIFHHETGTSVYLNTVVRILVSILRVHTFCQRSKAVSKFCITFLFLTFFRSQLAFAGDIIQCFININITGSLIQQRTAGIQLRLDGSQHIVNCRELNNGFTELLTVFSVCQSLIVCSLTQSDRLCGDTQTRTIHQGHDIFNQTELAFTAKFSFCILVNQFTSRRTMDTQLVLNTTNVYTTIVLVINEH